MAKENIDSKEEKIFLSSISTHISGECIWPTDNKIQHIKLIKQTYTNYCFILAQAGWKENKLTTENLNEV